MSIADTIQTNFTAGELSPLLLGRVDITRYQNGAKSLCNFIVRPQGGLMRRTGTRYLGQTKLGFVSLRPFQFSASQSYILEFGHQYVRFWQNDGFVAVNGLPVEVVTPYTVDEVAEIQITQSADVLYICHQKHSPRRLLRYSHTSWAMEEMSFRNGPYLPEDSSKTTLTMSDVIDRETLTCVGTSFTGTDVGKYIEYTRFGEIALGKIMEVTSATVLEIEPQENIYPRIDNEATFVSVAANVAEVTHSIFTSDDIGKFLRTAANTWYPITAYDGDAREKVSIGTVLTMATGTGEASNRRLSATITSPVDLFTTTDSGRWLRLAYSELQIDAQITAYVGPQEVDISFTTPMTRKVTDTTKFVNDGETDIWRLGAWSDDPTIGWPGSVAFYEQRLVLAASVAEPQTLWLSTSGVYDDFTPTQTDSKVVAANAITATIASNQINTILWLETGPNLIIGTLGAEWHAKAYDYSNPLSPSNIMVVQQTTHGSARVTPQRVGHSIMFVQRSARLLKELFYEYQTDSFTTRDLTILSEHLPRNGQGILDSAYQQQPYSLLWFVLGDGSLAGFTFEKDQEVLAWHRHTFSGGVVESIAVIPSIDGSEDQLHLSIKRTINGTEVRYIERLTSEYWPTDSSSMHYLDCALRYQGVSTDHISGLEHLEGQIVTVLGDGSVQDDRVVTGGAITIAKAASDVLVGLSYESNLESLNVEGGGQFGSSQGSVRRTHRITIRVLNTLGLKFGCDNDLSEYNFRDTMDAMDITPNLRTDDITVNIEQSYGINRTVRVVQSRPYPLNILALVHHMKVYQ